MGDVCGGTPGMGLRGGQRPLHGDGSMSSGRAQGPPLPPQQPAQGGRQQQHGGGLCHQDPVAPPPEGQQEDEGQQQHRLGHGDDEGLAGAGHGLQQHDAEHDDPLQGQGSEVEGQAADGGGEQLCILIPGVEHGDRLRQQLDNQPDPQAIDQGDLEPHRHQELEVAMAPGPRCLAHQGLDAKRQSLQDDDEDRLRVSRHGEARQILDRAVHHQLAVVQQQQQPQIELGDEARQPGEEQVRHGREAGHQLAPGQPQPGVAGEEVPQAEQADHGLREEGGLGCAGEAEPEPAHHDVVEQDVEEGAAAHQYHGEARAAVVAKQVGHRQVAGEQQGATANPGEVVAGLLPGVGAGGHSQGLQDIGVPVVQQQRRYRAQDQQQPEGADQSLAGQSEVPGALLEGDGGGGPHGDHGGKADEHHDDRIDQVDAGKAGGPHVVADEDAVHQVVGAGDQHGHDGGEGIAPETAGHGPLTQTEVGGHICTREKGRNRADSLVSYGLIYNQAFI